MPSLSATTSTGGMPVSSVRSASFAPAGFLISSMTIDLAPTEMRSKRPNAARKPSKPLRTAFGEVGDHRVVRVDDQPRLRREHAHGFAPSFGHDLELPVPVELIPEQVCE